mgnify:CR=1 FL=1
MLDHNKNKDVLEEILNKIPCIRFWRSNIIFRLPRLLCKLKAVSAYGNISRFIDVKRLLLYKSKKWS